MLSTIYFIYQSMDTTTTTATAVKYPKVGVSCILIAPQQESNNTGYKILIGIRKGSHGAGKLAPPGGHIELGEKWETTCQREVCEETSVDIPESRFHFITATNDCAIDGNPDKHYITIFMTATLTPEEVTQIQNVEPDKCEGWNWVHWKDVVDIYETTPGALFDPLMHFIQQKKM